MTPSGIAALCVCGMYQLLAFQMVVGLLSVPIVGILLLWAMWTVGYLVLYIGIPIAFVTWIFCIGYRVIIRKNKRIFIWTGIKYGIIIFGIMGLVFCGLGLDTPAAKTHMVGYWIHAKVWIDIDEIRDWMQEYRAVVKPDREIVIPRDEWPSSLRSLGWGALWYDPSQNTVTLHEGGGFVHYGLTVGPKGMQQAEHWWFPLKLEDGVWVWHDAGSP